MNDLRIIFMGTPDFAVGILEGMLKNNYNIVGVITAPDKPAGRGQKIAISAVKEYALAKNLKLLQPTNLKNETFLEELKALNANLQIIVAFRMLPKVVWSMPEYGTINLHASLLPDYRGAAPINWALINGETKTGVTTFFIDEKIDTGAIILKNEIEIENNEYAGTLHDKLMELGKITILETLELIKNNQITTILQPQNEQDKTAYKLNKENCKIDFSKNIHQIYNHIRGLSPYPAAWCYFKDSKNEWSVKIYEVEKIEIENNEPVGKLLFIEKSIMISVIGGLLNIKSIQFPNKKRMKTEELINGYKFNNQTIAY
ncbi:MAG: methionyl-tRNA formyltransferase [Flavobacterium sp.]